MLEDRTLPSVTWFPSLLGHHSPDTTADTPDPMRPAITTTSLPIATVAAPYTATVTAIGYPAPRFLEVSGPSGLTLDHVTGVITWTPTSLGTQTVVIKAGNRYGVATQVFTINVGPDVTPPSQTSLTVAAETTTSLTLGWAAATDNVGVAGYRLYGYTPAVYRGHSGRGGGYTLVSPAKYTLLADNISGTQYTIAALTPGASYQYAVAAFDGAGNVSYSPVLTARTWLAPSLTWSTNGVNTNPAISVVANHSLYMTLFAGGNPAPTLTLISAPAGVVFTPGQITNSQLTFVVPNITWTPTADEVGLNDITMEVASPTGTMDVVIHVTVIADVP